MACEIPRYLLNLPRPIAIVGLGISGKSALHLLNSVFPDEKIYTYDSRSNADFSNPEDLLKKVQPKCLVISPGIDLRLPWIQNFKDNGGKITSELSCALSFLSDETIIAITGSVGKSTVTSLLGTALKKSSPYNFFGGNLGTALSDYVTEVLSGRPRAQFVALELSSYQLENIENFKPKISVITSFTPNHLERYDSLEDYYKTKWSLLNYKSEKIILNSQSKDLVSFAKNHEQLNLSKFTWTSHQDESLKITNHQLTITDVAANKIIYTLHL